MARTIDGRTVTDEVEVLQCFRVVPSPSGLVAYIGLQEATAEVDCLSGGFAKPYLASLLLDGFSIDTFGQVYLTIVPGSIEFRIGGWLREYMRNEFRCSTDVDDSTATVLVNATEAIEAAVFVAGLSWTWPKTMGVARV